ncbi:MAG: hypothetical protein ACI4V1_03095, partial [Eubacteriales bacterium]
PKKKRELDGEELFKKSSSPNPTSKTFKRRKAQDMCKSAKKFTQTLAIDPDESFLKWGVENSVELT